MQQFSLAVAKIEMFRQADEQLICAALGTGFFYSANNETFLITNWHNVTGVNPLTMKAFHSTGVLPNLLRIHYKQWADVTKTAVRSQHFDLALYENDAPIWFEHRSRSNVDLVAVPLSIGEFDNFANQHINTIDQEMRLEVYVGMDCFILGFPQGMIGAGNTPIWKRGSIASEPFGQHPYLVDTATREGMSGAPVIAQHTGIFGKKGEALDGTEIIGTVQKFVGIYSGRIGDDSLGYQLGRVWQSSLLDDILSVGQRGGHPLQ